MSTAKKSAGFSAEGKNATLGFSDSAQLDDGDRWPTSFALTEWTPAVENQVTALIKRATK